MHILTSKETLVISLSLWLPAIEKRNDLEKTKRIRNFAEVKTSNWDFTKFTNTKTLQETGVTLCVTSSNWNSNINNNYSREKNLKLNKSKVPGLIRFDFLFSFIAWKISLILSEKFSGLSYCICVLINKSWLFFVRRSFSFFEFFLLFIRFSHTTNIAKPQKIFSNKTLFRVRWQNKKKRTKKKSNEPGANENVHSQRLTEWDSFFPRVSALAA